MILFLTLFGLIALCGAVYVSLDQNRERKEKLAKIQRELARREAAEAAKENAEIQD